MRAICRQDQSLRRLRRQLPLHKRALTETRNPKKGQGAMPLTGAGRSLQKPPPKKSKPTVCALTALRSYGTRPQSGKSIEHLFPFPREKHAQKADIFQIVVCRLFRASLPQQKNFRLRNKRQDGGMGGDKKLASLFRPAMDQIGQPVLILIGKRAFPARRGNTARPGAPGFEKTRESPPRANRQSAPFRTYFLFRTASGRAASRQIPLPRP